MITGLTCIRLRKTTIGTSGAKKAIAQITKFRALARYHSSVPALFFSIICRRDHGSHHWAWRRHKIAGRFGKDQKPLIHAWQVVE